MSFARRFNNPDGIVHGLPGVWVLTIPAYFNWCPFFLNTPNCRSPSGYHLILISNNGNSLFVTIWTLFYFAEGGGSCHSSKFPQWSGGVGFPPTCPLPAETPLTNYWALVRSSFPWTPPYRHLNRCCVSFSVSEGFWHFQTDKMQPGQKGMPINTLLFLTLVLPFRHRGICNNPRWRRSRLSLYPINKVEVEDIRVGGILIKV